MGSHLFWVAWPAARRPFVRLKVPQQGSGMPLEEITAGSRDFANIMLGSLGALGQDGRGADRRHGSALPVCRLQLSAGARLAYRRRPDDQQRRAVRAESGPSDELEPDHLVILLPSSLTGVERFIHARLRPAVASLQVHPHNGVSPVDPPGARLARAQSARRGGHNGQVEGAAPPSR